jgi:hypothetical protein
VGHASTSTDAGDSAEPVGAVAAGGASSLGQPPLLTVFSSVDSLDWRSELQGSRNPGRASV